MQCIIKRGLLILTLLIASLSLSAQSVTVVASLSGRNVNSSLLSIPEFDFSENGTVVVNIEVNREGVVTNAYPGVDGTTLKSGILWGRCRKAALEALFDVKVNAEEPQEGTISYTFSTSGTAPAVEPKKHTTGNPLAGSNLSDNFSLLDAPVDFDGVGRYKIFQVVAQDGALAQSLETKYSSMEMYGDPMVLLISDQPNVYYDDLIVTVGSHQKTIQLGTYRYETRAGFIKTVPIVMIVDR